MLQLQTEAGMYDVNKRTLFQLDSPFRLELTRGKGEYKYSHRKVERCGRMDYVSERLRPKCWEFLAVFLQLSEEQITPV